MAHDAERERKGFGKASVTAERDSFFPAAGQGDPEGFHPEIKLAGLVMNATTLRGHSVCMYSAVCTAISSCKNEHWECRDRNHQLVCYKCHIMQAP